MGSKNAESISATRATILQETVSKRLLRTSGDVPADEGETECKKCFVDVGATLNANAKTTKTVEACARTLDHPAKFSQSAAALGPALCDHRLDAAFTKFSAMWFGVVAAIGGNDLGFRSGRPRTPRIGAVALTSGSNWVTSLRFAPVRIVLTGTPFAIDEDVVLGTGSRAIRGVQASFLSTPTAAPRMNRQLLLRHRAGRPRVTSQVATRAAGPTGQPFVSRPSAASRSGSNQIFT
ncbi:hypothetical protein QFZ39_006503 [Paraburkholderia graminis]|nr:hypothetical protein [Paraburkholderia graminis]